MERVRPLPLPLPPPVLAWILSNLLSNSTETVSVGFGDLELFELTLALGVVEV